MKVILLKELKGHGGEGDVIDVARGFAVNYLLPQGIAIKATPGELKQLENRRHNIEKRELARTTDADAIKEALDGKTITVTAKVGDEGQLFGSITSAMLSEAIADQIGVTVDRKKIDTPAPIKTVGEHPVTISVYRTIKAEMTVEVLNEAGDTEVAAEVKAADDKAAESATEDAEATEEASKEAEGSADADKTDATDTDDAKEAGADEADEEAADKAEETAADKADADADDKAEKKDADADKKD